MSDSDIVPLIERPEQDAQFVARLKKSSGPVFAAARYLHALGDLEIYIGPQRIRPSFADREDYRDDGDMRVRKVGRERWMKVEAKGRTFSFTCAEDFPHPTFYMERPNRIARNGVAYAYFVVNQELTHAAVIYGATSPQWIGPTSFFDRSVGYQCQTMECPVELAKFVSLSVDE
jgi:hypothetical protein